MLQHNMVTIPVANANAQTRIDIHSGIYRYYPRIYGNHVRKKNGQTDMGMIIVHPMSNFHGHHMLEPIANVDIPIIGLNTRYGGNDAAVIFENCLLDINAAIRWVKAELGWKKVILAGFSGGGPLVSYYQAQAEHPTDTATPAGDPPDLTQAGLMPADALFLLASSVSRSDIMQHWIDPSVTNELDPDSRDPELDLYAEGRKPPYDRAWLAQYRAAQLARMQRIDTWVLAELKRLRALGINDRAFIVHRTVADPRLVDLTIDPSDREYGSIYGEPRVANESTGPMGRYTSLCAWLSSWSPQYARADAVKCLPQVSVPVGILCLTADQGALQCDSLALRDATPKHLCTYMEIKGANHYFVGQPEGPANAANMIREWASRI
jgi:pimeloyl-ACP methyl ester carboxylesterase